MPCNQRQKRKTYLCNPYDPLVRRSQPGKGATLLSGTPALAWPLELWLHLAVAAAWVKLKCLYCRLLQSTALSQHANVRHWGAQPGPTARHAGVHRHDPTTQGGHTQESAAQGARYGGGAQHNLDKHLFLLCPQDRELLVAALDLGREENVLLQTVERVKGLTADKAVGELGHHPFLWLK